MAQLIKLESGQYLNLDLVVRFRPRDGGGLNYESVSVDGSRTRLWPKDLEKIDQIADSTEVEYGEDLVLVTREAADKAGITYIMGG